MEEQRTDLKSFDMAKLQELRKFTEGKCYEQNNNLFFDELEAILRNCNYDFLLPWKRKQNDDIILGEVWYQPIGEFYYKNTIHRFEYLYIASTGLVIDKHRNKEMITKHGIKQFRKITEWYIFPNGKMELCRKNEEHNLIHFGKPIYVISVKKWNQVKSQDEKSNVK